MLEAAHTILLNFNYNEVAFVIINKEATLRRQDKTFDIQMNSKKCKD